MIPVKIELHNFLAYADPEPIDFTGLHVACLVGPNGAGKSSLLDAITWSLWGKARAAHDDLVRLGESEMWVTFEFMFGKNTYRVTRFRSSEGRGRSDLVLEIANDDQWHMISESTIRATQGKINEILRLDYDTFINSAFLAQGRADEFTNSMKPAERKQLLSEILNLGMWADYEDRAKAKAKELDGKLAQTDEELNRIEADLAQEATYQRELIEAQRKLSDTQEELREVEAHYREAQGHKRDWHNLQVQYENIQREVRDIDAQLERINTERDNREERWQSLQSLLEAQEEIVKGYDVLQQALTNEAAMTNNLKAHQSLRETYSELEQHIQHARVQLEAELKNNTQRAEELRHAIEKAPSVEQFDEVNAEIEALETVEADLEVMRAEQQAAQSERSGLHGHNEALKTEMDTLKVQQTALRESDSATCPTCGQPLDDDHRHSLIEEFQERGEAKRDTYRENAAGMKDLAATIQQLDTRIQEMQTEIKKLIPLRTRRDQLEVRFKELEKQQTTLSDVDEHIHVLQAALEAEDYAHEAQDQLADVRNQLAELGYDEAYHDELRQKIDEHREYERRKANLDNALQQVPDIEDAITNLNERETYLLEKREGILSEGAEIEQRGGELQALLEDFDELEANFNKLRDDLGDQKYAVGAAEQRVKSLEASRARKSTLLERREDLAEQKALYVDLRQAFGKDGVPAMVIETAIPEIEQEANQLLGRMTDGRMHVRFDTQREKKTGGAMETLDIRIADELGTRDYATFSGGEAFRVNFAIRLALSRILARRAGAQLRTLIIDEGFGTQDAQGRERLVQSINAIQDEFDLLLVITHIDELKDAFPVRIEVTKLSGGSVVEII